MCAHAAVPYRLLPGRHSSRTHLGIAQVGGLHARLRVCPGILSDTLGTKCALSALEHRR